MKKIIFIILRVLAVILLGFFLLLAAGFFAVRFGWTNVAGEEDGNSFEYNQEAHKENSFSSILNAVLPNSPSIYGPKEKENWCKLNLAADTTPYNAKIIFQIYQKNHSQEILDRMLLALKLRLKDKNDFSRQFVLCERESNQNTALDDLTKKLDQATGTNVYSWQNGESWQIIRQAIIKDKPQIYQASEKAGISPRLLVSVAIVEQLRLYYTQRELFEKVFRPLKILANANKMAWGVMSIKEKMAIETEEHLRDSNSPFYLGPESSTYLDFSAGADIAKERYARLTNEKNHYYSYLYGALIIRQFVSQWQRAGYGIANRPEIVATLFNIGFHNSYPKKDPSVGGSTIEIDGEKYFFGSLAYEFYYSGELIEDFPIDQVTF